MVGFGHRKALAGVTTVASEKVRFGSNDDVDPPRIGYAIMSPNGLAETRSDSRCLLSDQVLLSDVDQVAIIFSFVIGNSSSKVCIGFLPKHQRP